MQKRAIPGWRNFSQTPVIWAEPEDSATSARDKPAPAKRPVIDDPVIKEITTRLSSAERPYRFLPALP